MTKGLRALPCRHCQKAALLPDGKPYLMYSLEGRTSYKCSRCKKKTSITSSQFNFLPLYKKSID